LNFYKKNEFLNFYKTLEFLQIFLIFSTILIFYKNFELFLEVVGNVARFEKCVYFELVPDFMSHGQ